MLDSNADIPAIVNSLRLRYRQPPPKNGYIEIEGASPAGQDGRGKPSRSRWQGQASRSRWQGQAQPLHFSYESIPVSEMWWLGLASAMPGIQAMALMSQPPARMRQVRVTT